MKKSIETDKQCVTKIMKYTGDIKLILEADNIQSFQDLKKSLAAKYAITQLITNIYEVRNKIQDETIELLPLLKTIPLKQARQIASHDYTSIDFKPIFHTCLKLRDEKLYNELNNFLVGDTNAN